jgi:hypothetical protein
MKKISIFLIAASIIYSCGTKQIVIDTGVANPVFPGNMMQYLRSDNYNWGLTVEVIERAGLTDLFEGKVDTLPQITFWGPKSASILRFLLDSQYKDPSNGVFLSVSDMPVEMCRTLILKHVVKGKHLKDNIAYRNRDYYISAPQQDGGTDFTCLSGNVVRAYLEKSAYAGVPDAGPVHLKLFSLDLDREVPVATPNIQPSNGVVHALNYGNEFGEI